MAQLSFPLTGTASKVSGQISMRYLPSWKEGGVMIGAAVDDEKTFGDLGAVTVSIDGPDGTFATFVLDLGTVERTMVAYRDLSPRRCLASARRWSGLRP